MIRHAVAFVLFVLCLFFGAMGYQAYAVSASAAPVNVGDVLPLLSPRRVPELAGSLTQEALLRDSVTKAIANTPASSLCLEIQREGRPVFLDNTTAPYIPASVAKLLTATAALEVFGANHTFTTRVVAKSKIKNGTLDGPLYLVGGGDPLLMTDDYVSVMDGHRNTHSSLEKLADQVVASGVKSIHGGIIGDDSRFDNMRYLPSWEESYRTSGQVGPVGALSVNQGFAIFNKSGKTSAENPTIAAAAKFRDLLMARGVTIDQGPAAGVAPDNTSTVSELASLPLSGIIGEMLTESDNTTAEIVLKNVGVEVYKHGTFADGVKATLSKLQDDGLALSDVYLVDGSGLDRSDRVTCSAIAAVLAHDGANGVLANGMAKAGETGTLATRFNNTIAMGRLQAKTGTLAGVSALAGWARPEAQQPFDFVIITNGVAATASRALEDQIALLLTSQPKTAPSANAFAPEGVVTK